jgi:hypothetical protein
MAHTESKQPIVVVTACMKPDGRPDFTLNLVEVTEEEPENGVHYYLVEARLAEAGYEEPFVHFDENEAPAFLFPTVRQHLNPSPTVVVESNPVHAEPKPCPVSSK